MSSFMGMERTGIKALSEWIKNIGLTNTNISMANSTISGLIYVGGLIGNAAGASSAISNAYTTGTLSYSMLSPNNAGGAVGGLVGNQVAGSITNSYSTESITIATQGFTSSYSNGVGGLVGYNSGVINTSYAAGVIQGNAGGGTRLGGFAGEQTGSVTAAINNIANIPVDIAKHPELKKVPGIFKRIIFFFLSNQITILFLKLLKKIFPTIFTNLYFYALSKRYFMEGVASGSSFNYNQIKFLI